LEENKIKNIIHLRSPFKSPNSIRRPTKKKNDQPTPDMVSTAPSTQFDSILFERENLSHSKQNSMSRPIKHTKP
jgi:hypothetical protein